MDGKRSNWPDERKPWGWVWAYLRLLRPADHSPLFFTFGSRDPGYAAHRYYNAIVLEQLDGPWALVRLSLSVATWPLRAIVLAILATARHGPDVRRMTGIGLIRQYGEQIGLALRYSVPPSAYYTYRLYAQGGRERAPYYLHNYEGVLLFPYLNRGLDVTVLSNKGVFFARCRRAGLPVVPVLCEITPESEACLPAADFVVKPVRGSQGRGVERWVAADDGLYWSRDGRVMVASELLAHLLHRSERGGLLVQPRMRNHAAIADLSNGSLCTVRIVTGRKPDGQIEALLAVFRMPMADGVADNFAAGGIASPVDLATGELGSAVLKKGPEDYHRHPDGEGVIPGRLVPCWDQVLGLARRAHKEFSEFPFLGWDVAVTGQGPLLIEVNEKWCAVLSQRPHHAPLGLTQFPLFLEGLLAGQWAAKGPSDHPREHQG
jgi:hypothetical protein